MSKPRVFTRINPAIIRAVVLDAERTTNVEAGKRVGVSDSTVSDWRRISAQLGDWPNDQDIADWRAHQEASASARESDRRYSKRRYFAKGKLTIDATGTRRRVQALYALGWTWDALAAEMGVRKGSVWRLAHGAHCTDRGVYRETAAAVVALFERLCMTRPEGWVADRARNVAIRNGWVPPLAWDNIDDPSEQPTDWQYRAPTRAELLDDLDERGAGISEVMQALDITRQSLERWCVRNGRWETFVRLRDRENWRASA